MDILKILRDEPRKALKVTGIAALVVVLLLFALQVVSATLGPVASRFGLNSVGTVGMMAPSAPMGMSTGGYGGDMMYEESYAVSQDAALPEFSARNAASIAPRPDTQTTGDNAEDYEVTQYSASFETRHLEGTCDDIAVLKERTDVIFENASTGDRYCNFTFKVKHESVEEVLGLLEAMDPKDLSEETYTIKARVDDYTSEEEVLRRKRDSIDATLTKALVAYDDITTLATRTENADALAKIIDSKIGVIERLTQERININTQLDRLARAKTEQLDRLDYTYFYVNVYENRYLDWENIGDSWKAAVKDLVRNINGIVQGLTINLFLVVFLVVQWAIYAFIALIVVKYGWRMAKRIWQR